MNILERNMMESAKDLRDYIKTLGLSAEQSEKIDNLILKHIDDCVHWGIQVKLAEMLEEMGEDD
ncbi:hypothetical protein MWG07_09930 [Fusobacterium necrophorum]|uniref:Phage protein n=1 Tax=Fusobacterium necrophorum TaxID=859 RepID=A0AAW6WD95_9FUSO|nr:hypothetical protein [Fusobacterium necrophorum]MDK4481962.1 hypothetical protein [Fusobacterium necrophorum]MDK4512568.1 hypothetical protein [Fusobacterium necrophorum]